MRTHRLKNIMHAWRYQPTTRQSWTNSETSQTPRSTRPRPTLRSALGRSRERYVRMGRKWTRSQLHLRQRHSFNFPQGTRYRLGLQSPSSRGRRIWVLRKASAGDYLQCPQLLWGVLEFRCCDECRRVPDVLVSDPQVQQKEKMMLCNTTFNFTPLPPIHHPPSHTSQPRPLAHPQPSNH